jgi:hypothetical protein
MNEGARHPAPVAGASHAGHGGFHDGRRAAGAIPAYCCADKVMSNFCHGEKPMSGSLKPVHRADGVDRQMSLRDFIQQQSSDFATRAARLETLEASSRGHHGSHGIGRRADAPHGWLMSKWQRT